MEDTMHWLRQTELYLRTCDAATLSDVEKYYGRLKVIENIFYQEEALTQFTLLIIDVVALSVLKSSPFLL